MTDRENGRNGNDITEIVLRCRECIRMVWNSYVRDLDDGERAFLSLQDQLVEALIVSQIKTYELTTSVDGARYYRGIRLGSVSKAETTEVLFPEKSSGSVLWRPRRVNLDALDLRFGDFYDFVTFDMEFRDFKFVEAFMPGNQANGSSAGRCLVPSLEARYFEVV